MCLDSRSGKAHTEKASGNNRNSDSLNPRRNSQQAEIESFHTSLYASEDLLEPGEHRHFQESEETSSGADSGVGLTAGLAARCSRRLRSA